jgi:hypothetical protein
MGADIIFPGKVLALSFLDALPENLTPSDAEKAGFSLLN